MKKLSNLVLVIVFITVFQTSVSAQQKEVRKTTLAIEIDPATFAFKGYAFHLRVNPKNHKHLLLGAGMYAMDFPDILINLNSKNKDQGWGVRLNQGYGLFAEHHFLEVNKKWFVGGQLAIQQYKINNNAYAGESAFTNVLLMGTGGYTLRPFDFGLYFKFWAGIGYTAKVAGENMLGNTEYDIAPILLFGALHLGYTF